MNSQTIKERGDFTDCLGTKYIVFPGKILDR